MILFSLSAIALLGLAIGIILPALLNRRPLNPDDSDQQNIRIARRRLEELEEELERAGDSASVTQSNVAQSRAEIESALLDDLGDTAGDRPDKPSPNPPGKAWTALILVMIPLISAGLYLKLGNPLALTPPGLSGDSRQNSPPEKAPPLDVPPLDVLVRQLEQKLAANPDNAEGWALVGKTYMHLGWFAKAERAYHALHQLVGDNPDVLTAWADAAVLANDGIFSPEIVARLERALELSPEHHNALWSAALGAESRADYRPALDYLARLLPLLESDPQAALEVNRFIDKIRRLSQPETSGRPVDTAKLAETKNPRTAGHRGLTVRVELAPLLAGEIRADHTVYVFATAVDGPPTPLAVSRHRASELPVSIILDDSMAMLSGMKISAFERVSVMARLSRSGNPAAQPGDIESVPVITRTDNQSPLNLVIDQVVAADAAQ